jgi:hypothetical protein
VAGYRDTDIVPLSFVGAELGLDYHTPEVARRLVDKLRQREALRNAGLPTPLCWEVPADREPAAIEALAAEVEYPAVLKPRRGSGSKYAMPVADAGDLVRQVATLPPQAGGETGMFVEQYLPGLAKRPNERFADYISVESLVAHGEISHLAMNGRFPLAEPFRETGTFIPLTCHRLSRRSYSRLRRPPCARSGFERVASIPRSSSPLLVREWSR